MSKIKEVSKAASENEAVKVVKERIGVFYRNWKRVTSYGNNSMNVHVKNFNAGQLVFREDEILSLLNEGAPIKVYIEDVD